MDFADRWTIRGSAGDLVALLRRAAEFLDSLGPVAVSGLTLDREADDVVLTVAFDHGQLPADLDYLDPRMAAGHYGEGQRDDIDFIVALAAELDARTVVDFGCGTGQLAVAVGKGGRRVIAVDPAKAMLDLARTRDGADLVEWVWGDASTLGMPDADLIVMTGNIPSIYVTDEGWEFVLSAIDRALRPGGYLAILSWNPEVRPWEQWNGILVDVDHNRVRCDYTDPPMVVSEAGRETLVAGSEWRYRTHEELTRSLTRAGFVVEQTYGDWHGAPFTPASPDIVLIAHRI